MLQACCSYEGQHYTNASRSTTPDIYREWKEAQRMQAKPDRRQLGTDLGLLLDRAVLAKWYREQEVRAQQAAGRLRSKNIWFSLPVLLLTIASSEDSFMSIDDGDVKKIQRKYKKFKTGYHGFWVRLFYGIMYNSFYLPPPAFASPPTLYLTLTYWTSFTSLCSYLTSSPVFSSVTPADS